jgi:adenylate kinase
MKRQMIVFMGGAGSGKGTYAHLLMKKHKFNYIEVGAILRELPKRSEIVQKITRGELLTDNELFPIVSTYITTNKDIILDGFPRTLGQAKWLIENYADKFNIKVVFLDVNKTKMIAHIKNRIKEGGNRADDNDENAVNKRIELFKKTTLPAVKWLKTLDNIEFINIKIPSDDINTNFEYIYSKL